MSKLFSMKKEIAITSAGRFLVFKTNHIGNMKAKNLGSEMKFPI
jgi:hypothetical protein